jgi:serine/threonine protein phosphatase PrpC
MQHAIELTRQNPEATTLYGSPSFAILTRQSNEHTNNQDKSVFVSPFITTQTPQDTDTPIQSWLTGVFDGHGSDGHSLAAYVKTALPRLLAEKLNTRPCCHTDDEDWIRHVLNDTFVEIDRDAPPTAALRGGCTATITLRLGNKLYLANTGDSRSVVMQYFSANNITVPYQTYTHKANHPEEYARILRMGGTVHIPPQNANLSRVIAYSTANIPAEPIGLAMSRSIGDWEWGADGVIPDPTMDVIDLEASNLLSGNVFLMTSSDGLWDLRTREFYAQHIGEALYDQRVPPLIAGFDIIYRVAPMMARWYRDDITMILVKL